MTSRMGGIEMTTVESGIATQVYVTYVRGTPEQVWQAIVDPEAAARYGYGGSVAYELHPGGAYAAGPSEGMKANGAPDVVVSGEVLEVDAPHRLVQTWHAHFGPATDAECPTRLTWEIAPQHEGVTRLTLTHELDGAPVTAGFVGGTIPDTGGGWSYVLSGLKTLVETGESFTC
jgi:uncharacterized protein YndB with AHSA1/START domain